MPIVPHIDIETQKIITDWVVASGTILLSVITVFQDKIRLWILRPKLSLLPVKGIKSPFIVEADGGPKKVAAFLVRLEVSNKGNQDAENVEVFVSELQIEQADGTYKKIDEFPAQNLIWAYQEGGMFSDVIRPGMRRHCEFCVIIKPQERVSDCHWDNSTLTDPVGTTILGFQLTVLPFTKAHLVGPGKYKLLIHVAAKNVRPLNETIQLTHTGKWFDDANDMSSQGLGIRII